MSGFPLNLMLPNLLFANSEESDIAAQSHLNLHWLSMAKVPKSHNLFHMLF